MIDDKKCGHTACGCPAADDTGYCSASCQEANSNDATDAPCDCGCDGCK